MVRKLILLSGILSVGMLLTACSKKPTGPDQTLVTPAGWTISEHEPGDLHYSKWTLESGETKMIVNSFVAPGAPEETLKKMEAWKQYMEESVQYGQFMSRSWPAGKFQVIRYYAYMNPNEKNHGTTNLWLINPDRELAVTISNPNMTREPMIALADQVANELAKANQANLK